MLVFPDPNDSTEYTDPNGDKWEFNGTGWVRQPDCSGSGGGGGGAAGLPVGGWKMEIAHKKLGSSTFAGLPVVIGDDIYLPEKSSSSVAATQAYRYKVDTSTYAVSDLGIVSFPALGTTDLNYSSEFVGPLFQLQYGGNRVCDSGRDDYYLQKEADGSVTKHSIDAGWANAKAAAGVSSVTPRHKIIDRNGRLVVAFTSADTRSHFLVVYNEDGTVYLSTLGSGSCKLNDLTPANTVGCFVVATDYGYCLAAGGATPNGISYACATFDHDGVRIRSRSNSQQFLDGHASGATFPQTPVPTTDGRGLCIEFYNATAKRAYCFGYFVEEDGQIPNQYLGSSYKSFEPSGFAHPKASTGVNVGGALDKLTSNSSGNGISSDSRALSSDGRLLWIRPDHRSVDNPTSELTAGGAFPISYTCTPSDVVNEDGTSIGKSLNRQVIMPANVPCPQISPKHVSDAGLRGSSIDVPIVPYIDGVWVQFRQNILFVYSETPSSSLRVAPQARGSIPIEVLASDAGMSVSEYLDTDDGKIEKQAIIDWESEFLNREQSE
jgi:hypothetical protein